MSNRTFAALAGVCAMLLTAGSWWQVMIYKIPPHANLALWLPFIVILRAHEILAIFIFFVQFPTLAVLFVFASRRWNRFRVLLIMIAFYALCVWAAMAMLKAGLWA